MELEGKKFGKGPRELTGAIDLIDHYKLLPHHVFFCKRPLPLSIADTRYLHTLVGDKEIRKGEGMQLDQLSQDSSDSRDGNVLIQSFDLDVLSKAFQFRERTPVELPSVEKGIPTNPGKSESESKGKESRHKKHKDRDKEDREHKKRKHRHKDRMEKEKKDKEKRKDRSGHLNSAAEHSKKHHEKKRKHDGDENALPSCIRALG